jgi:hypothetical protein
VVEGALDSTKLFRRKRNVEASAPSTTVRSLRELQWSPSPAIAGADGASDLVLATHDFRPSFAKAIAKNALLRTNVRPRSSSEGASGGSGCRHDQALQAKKEGKK